MMLSARGAPLARRAAIARGSVVSRSLNDGMPKDSRREFLRGRYGEELQVGVVEPTTMGVGTLCESWTRAPAEESGAEEARPWPAVATVTQGFPLEAADKVSAVGLEEGLLNTLD